MAVFMIYLVMFIVLTQAVAAGVAVKQSTGDVVVDFPLMTVPGTGGLNHPVSMTYMGAGIKMDHSSSWVGLGFSLSSGSISRTVVGIPDDATNDLDNVWMKNWSDSDFEQVWWRTVLDWIFVIIVIVIAIILTILTGGTDAPIAIAMVVAAVTSALSSIAIQLYFTGSVDWDSVKKDAFWAAVTAGVMSGIDKLDNVKKLADHAETVGRFQKFAGCAAVAVSVGKAVSSFGGSKSSDKEGDNTFDYLIAMNGYLREPFYQEAYSDNNFPWHDGGSPDNWNIGGPLSGTMIIADEATHARHSDIDDAKFFLENAPSTENVDIEYDMDVDGHIVRFIVTGNDGTRYIYGDNQDDALVWSFSSGSYIYHEQDYSDGGDDSSYKSKTMNMFFEPHVVEWKLTAILAPDYVDGSSTPDYNPYDVDETNNKGSWMAFTYNKVYYYGPDSPNCGFNLGNSYGVGELQDTFDWVSAYNEDNDGTKMKHGGVTELTYLESIVSPTHIADFNISMRADGREKQVWEYSTSKGPHGFNFDVGNFCQDNDVGCASDRLYCSGLEVYEVFEWVPIVGWVPVDIVNGSTDYPYKLDTIDLQVRLTNEPLAVVKFNDGVANSEMYALKPGTPGYSPDENVNAGVYTLNHIDVCNNVGLDCKRAEFYY